MARPSVPCIYFVLFIFLCLQCRTASCQDGEVAPQVVNIEIIQGRLFGIRVDHEDGEYHFEFRKIPYAEPPVGELRFRDPLPKGKWEDPLNATAYGPVCAQPGTTAGAAENGDDAGFAGDEDCLHLNVHTPRIPKSGGIGLATASLLPVMVYFHGGGFSGGSVKDLKTEWILQRDVVVVTLNYRVGALGFLTLGNSFVAGNMGLKDQLLALKWVNENIKTFGGDPSKVTLIGSSAGGMSAHFHQLSPQGNNLYRAVIAMSGSALHFAAPMAKGQPEWTGQMFVSRLGCQKGGIADIIWCLQECLVTDILKLSPSEFNYAQSLENDLRNRASLTFFPNVDHYSQNPFLPDLPINIMRQGKQKDIPLILGTVEEEGALWALVIWKELEEFNGNWTYHGPRLMYYDDVHDIPYHHELVANVTRHFYTGGLNFSQSHAYGIINMFTDQQFLSPAVKSAKIQEKTQKSPVYFYELTHKPSISIVSLFGSDIAEESKDWGVTHGDDLVFLFREAKGIKNAIATDEDMATSDNILNLFTNLATHKDPTPFQDGVTPTWTPFTETRQHHMVLKPDLEIRRGIHKSRIYFWEKMFWADHLKKLEEQAAAAKGGSANGGSYGAPPAASSGHTADNSLGPFRYDPTTAARRHFLG